MKRKQSELEEQPSEGSEKKIRIEQAGKGLYHFGNRSLAVEVEAFIKENRPIAEELFKEFVSASNSLRGAMAFEDQFLNLDPDFSYRKEHNLCRHKFSAALPKVLDLTLCLDERCQRAVVDRVCNTEKIVDAGHAANLACEHLAAFYEKPRAVLLMNVIHFLPHDHPDVRAKALSHLSEARRESYLEKAHFDALNTVQSEMPEQLRKPIFSLMKQLASAMTERSGLESFPTEILHKILIDTVADDLDTKDVKKLHEVSHNIDAIGLVSRRLQENARTSSLTKLSQGFKGSRRTAEKRFRRFMDASVELLAGERDPDIDVNSPEHQDSRNAYFKSFKDVVASTRYFTKDEQLKIVSEPCLLDNARDVAILEIIACEYMDDFHEKPLSNLLRNVIQLMPHHPNQQTRACEHLAKAHLRNYLKEEHVDAINIVDLTELPGLTTLIETQIERLRSAMSASPDNAISSAMMKPAFIDKDRARDAPMIVFDEARQTLQNKVSERTFGRSS